MSDIIPLGGDDKSPISPSVIKRDIYRLKSFLIAEQRAEYDSPATAELSAEYFEEETSRLLVLVSLEVRQLIEIYTDRSGKGSTKSQEFARQNKRSCGIITTYTDNTEDKNLTFKKAYNSIIHAKEINFRDPAHPDKSYDGVIVTRNIDKGDKGKFYEYQAKINSLILIERMLDCVNLAIDN